MKKTTAKKIAVLAVMCVVAFIITVNNTYLMEDHAFLNFEVKDAIFAICGFIYGPLECLIMVFIVAFAEMLAVGDSYFGFLMNTAASLSFALTAAIIYRKRRNTTGMAVSLFGGVAMMTVMMLLWNYTMTPLGDTTISREAVTAMLLPVFLPFNLTKGLAGAGLALVLYNPLHCLLVKLSAIAPKEDEEKRIVDLPAMVLGVIVLAICTFIFLSYRGIF